MTKTKPLTVGDDFTVKITSDVYRKVMYWIHKSNHEVSGFGNVEYDPETKEFLVNDVMLILQENGPTSSEIDPKAMGKAMYEMHQKGQANGMKWWWHSHVNMNVFWSGDDMECIRSLGQQGWLISTVFNKREEMRSSFYDAVKYESGFFSTGDARQEVFIDELDTSIEWNWALTEAEAEAWDKEYDDKVIPEKKIQSFSNYYRGGVRGNYYDQYTEYYGGYDDAEEANQREFTGLGLCQEDIEILRAAEANALSKKDKSVATKYWEDQMPTYPSFDNEGWAFCGLLSRPVYNPARDQTITKDQREVEAIDMAETDPEAFRLLYREVKSFKKLANKAIGYEEREEVLNGTSN